VIYRRGKLGGLRLGHRSVSERSKSFASYWWPQYQTRFLAKYEDCNAQRKLIRKKICGNSDRKKSDMKL
jgi:hypothetical protein